MACYLWILGEEEENYTAYGLILKPTGAKREEFVITGMFEIVISMSPKVNTRMTMESGLILGLEAEDTEFKYSEISSYECK
jgi:hypothetical protein